MPEARYAVLIGNTYYPFDERLSDLQAPEHDVDGLAEVLGQPLLGRFETVTCLKNPTHHDVFEALTRVGEAASPESLILVYFSGYASVDAHGRCALAVMNTQTDLLGATSVGLERLRDVLDNGRATRAMLLLDWCLPEADRARLDAGTLTAHMQRLWQGRRTYVLMAPFSQAAPRQKQTETSSTLTKYILEGIRTGQADRDRRGYVTFEQLYQYVYPKVLAEVHQEPWRLDERPLGEEAILAWTPERAPEMVAGRSPTMRARYDAIMQMLKKGEVIPFLGPMLADRSADSHLPGPQELAERLAQSAGLTASTEPLTLVSQKVHIVAGRGVVYENLREIYHHAASAYLPTLTHRFLARLPYPLLMLSTAYDTLLEQAFEQEGKPYAVVTHIVHAENAADRGKVVVQYSTHKDQAEKCLSDELVIDLQRWSVIYKIHGTFGLCDPESDEEIDSIVISEEDYIALITMLDNPQTTIPNQLARQFKKRMFLFLGYHMSDWNFRAVVDVIHRKGNFRRIQPYAVRSASSEFERLYWESKQVRLLDTDLAPLMHNLAAALGIRL